MSSNTTSSLHMFRDRHAPASWVVARLMAFIVASTAAFMYTIFMAIVWKAYRKPVRRDQKSRRLVLRLLLGNLVFSFLGMVLWAMWGTAFSGLDVNFCNYWARLGGVFYVMCSYYSYSILQKRAEAVGVIQGSSKREQLLFKSVMFAVKFGTACMPLVAVACMLLFTGKTYFIEEYCTEVTTDVITWLFLLVDTSLSGGYLLLFILPVMVHLRKMRSITPAATIDGPYSVKASTSGRGSGSDSVRATAIRNLKISSVAITSTFLFMLGTSLLASFASSDDQDDAALANAHWQMWQYYGGPTDLFVNAVCNMLITKKLWSTEAGPRRKRIVGPNGTTVHSSSNMPVSTATSSTTT